MAAEFFYVTFASSVRANEKYATVGEARDAAKELAAKYSGREVVVLKAVKFASAAKPTATEADPETPAP